jgi:hypothetical protein
MVQLGSTTNPGAVTIPQAGVITKWKVNVIPYPGGISEKLKVLRPAGGNSFTVVGESTVQPIAGGLNSFDTRVPVQAGDRLGAYSPLAPIFCEEASTPTDVLGTTIGDPSLGSTAAFTERPKGQLAVAATVEPDADNDGYGDETQDKCPQNAAVQASCPAPPLPVALSSTSIAKKSLVTVLITSNSQAPVTVTGTTKLGNGKSAKLSGGTQVVVPGAIAKFTLLFPEKLQAALKQLSGKQFVWLNIVATAPNSAGAITTSNLKVKLKGQAKPRHHAKAKTKPKGQA